VVGDDVDCEGLSLAFDGCRAIGVLLRAATPVVEGSAGRRREVERSEEPGRAVKYDLVLLAPMAAGCD
jgi:hypothetical protein